MAGAGVRLFTAGSVLTASQVNAYLMDQTIGRFADSAARDAAFGGLGEPSLSEGRVCYLDSDNKLYLYDGSAWVEIGAQIEDLEVTTAKINDLAVTTGKIADSAVTSAKIADGTIVNADVNASAAVALSKLATGTVGSIVVHNASGVPTATAVTGDVTITSGGVTAIATGVIVNADVNASAAIDYSKLAALTSGNILVGNASNVATSVAMSGDVTITNAGVTAIGSGVIVNDDINSLAGIALSKLATSTAGNIIVYNSSGVPTSVTETGDISISDTGVTAIGSGVIVNADVNASAAIELGKIADATIDEKLASYELVLTDKNKFIKMFVASTANTVTVPPNASVAFPVGSQIHIIQYGSGKTQVLPGSGVTIYGTPGAYLRAQYSAATLLKCDTNIWMLMGDLSAS